MGEFPRFDVAGQVALVTGAARAWDGPLRWRWRMQARMLLWVYVM